MTPQRASKDLADPELVNHTPLTMAHTGLRATTPSSFTSLRAETVLLVSELAGALSRVRVESDGHVIEVDWDQATPAAPIPPAIETSLEHSEANGTGPPAGHHRITAPLVGAFYRCPEPAAAPFVAVGDTVQEGQQLAIIEAMKLMNPVTADRSGVLVAFHAEDAEMVEFGQPLIEIDTTGFTACES